MAHLSTGDNNEIAIEPQLKTLFDGNGYMIAMILMATYTIQKIVHYMEELEEKHYVKHFKTYICIDYDWSWIL